MMSVRKLWYVIMPMILGFLFVFLGLLLQNVLENFLYDTLFPNLQEIKMFQITLDVLFFTVLSLVFVGLAKLIYKDYSILGFSKHNMGKQLLLGYLTGFAFVAVMALGYLFISQPQVNIVVNAHSLSAVIFSMIFYCAQGTQEEVITRGFILGGIAKETNVWLGILMSSVFFALMHLSNAGGVTLNLIDYFLFGFLLAILRMITGNTWFVSAFHAAYNLTITDIFGLSQKLEESEGVVLQIIHNSSVEYMGMIVSVLLLAILSKRILIRSNSWQLPLKVK